MVILPVDIDRSELLVAPNQTLRFAPLTRRHAVRDVQEIVDQPENAE